MEAASAFVGDVLTAATGRRWDEPLGLPQYRYPRQRRTTVMLHAPENFLREVLWPEFEALNEAS